MYVQKRGLLKGFLSPNHMVRKMGTKRLKNSNGVIFGGLKEEFQINLEKNILNQKDYGDFLINLIFMSIYVKNI